MTLCLSGAVKTNHEFNLKAHRHLRENKHSRFVLSSVFVVWPDSSVDPYIYPDTQIDQDTEILLQECPVAAKRLKMWTRGRRREAETHQLVNTHKEGFVSVCGRRRRRRRRRQSVTGGCRIQKKWKDDACFTGITPVYSQCRTRFQSPVCTWRTLKGPKL